MTITATQDRTWTIRYTLLAALLGLLLPFIATFLDTALNQRPLTVANFLDAQANQPLLWIVDLAPALLAILAYAVGRRQDFAVRLNAELESRIRQVSDANEALACQMRERAELEEQLRHSQKLEAVGRLAGGVAHDFNNLLTAIIGYADLLTSELGVNDQRKVYAEEIHKAGKRAAGLVQQLLGFSRKQMVAPRVVDLNAVLADSRRLLERVIGEDIRLDLIESEDSVSVLIDPVQVDQVLVNLVVNARDAMPEGGMVTLRADRLTVGEGECDLNGDAKPGDYCLLEVSDTGVGMDETTLDKIFEPFFTTKDKAKGTGLGLATVYGILKQNGGFINVLSHLGDGATFRVYLPYHEKAKSDRMERPERLTPGGKECVLLVEDEKIVRRLASMTLRDRGYEVLEAEHSDAAVKIWCDRKDDVDILVTDVIMPGEDGKHLFERLRNERPDMPVLFMSGYDDELLSEHDVFEGTPPFIPKPFTVEALAGKIREVLDA